MRWRRILPVLAVLLASAACSDDGDISATSASATSSTAASSSTSEPSTTTEAPEEEASPEQVVSYWALAETRDRPGPERITEVIEYDFGDAERHGIYRDVPGLDPDAPVRVSSETAPDQLLVINTREGARIRIGNPDRTITGMHRYTIRYPIELSTKQGLAWDAVGTGWDVPIQEVEVHVTGPRRWKDLRCVAGQNASTTPCDDVRQVEPGHVKARHAMFRPHQGMTVAVTAGRALDHPPRPPSPD